MDDFYRIPKSLCYFMMRHPPLQGRTMEKSRNSSIVKIENLPDKSIGSGEQPSRKKKGRKEIEKDENTRNDSTTVTRRSKEILGIKMECPSEEERNAIELDDIPLDIREMDANKRPKTRKKIRKIRKSVIYECETCSLSFPLKGQYTRHMIKHSLHRSHKCDVCEKAFKRKSELKSHMQLHSGIKFTCDECNFETTNKVSVRTHVRRVHERDFRYECNECQKSFMSNSELKDHRTSHLGTKSFICEICGKAYLQKSYLVAHKRTVHGVVQKSLVKEHHCDICNKNFASEYILKNHAGVHSRKFLCTHCGKEFATNHGLQLHNRLHTGEKPFQCKYCSKSFTRPNTLRLHNLTHTGQRPYVCDICGQSFTQRSSMMGHRKKHPGSHPPPPPTLLSRSENNTEANS